MRLRFSEMCPKISICGKFSLHSWLQFSSNKLHYAWFPFIYIYSFDIIVCKLCMNETNTTPNCNYLQSTASHDYIVCQLNTISMRIWLCTTRRLIILFISSIPDFKKDSEYVIKSQGLCYSGKQLFINRKNMSRGRIFSVFHVLES